MLDCKSCKKGVQFKQRDTTEGGTMKPEDMKRLAEEFVRSGNYRDVNEVRAFLKDKGYGLNSLYQELEMSSRLVDTHI